MERHQLFDALLVLSLSSVAIGVEAQPTAERPNVKVGDKWIYQITKRTDQSSTGPGNRTVLEVSDERIKTVRPDGTSALFDRSWNAIDPSCHPECFRPTFRFPMHVGNKWEFERKISKGGKTQTGFYEVVAFESIAVPAGTFECFRVQGEHMAELSYFLHTYWYCPQVNNIAKQSIERRISVKHMPGQFDRDEVVLTKFIPGR